MNEAAVKYLEAHFDKFHTDYRVTYSEVEAYPNANILTHGGVIARRPMFELIEDHENVDMAGHCWMCRNG